MAGIGGRGIAMPTDELLNVAINHGFELIRQTNHRIIKRGAMKFTLPSTGVCNAWVTTSLLNVCEAIDVARRSQTRTIPILPLMVEWKGHDYAVRDQRAIHWFIQSLEDGSQKWVPKKESRIVEVDLPAYEPKPEDIVMNHESEMPLPAWPAAPAPAASNGHSSAPESVNPNDAWLRDTARLIERYQVRIDTLKAQIEPLEAQLRGLILARDTVAGASQPEVLRRVVLPSQANGAKPSAGGRVPDAVKENAKSLWQAGGMSVTQIAATVNIKPSSLYNWIVGWKKQGLTQRK